MTSRIRKLAGVLGVLALGFTIGVCCRDGSVSPSLPAADAQTTDASSKNDDAVNRYSPVRSRARDFYAPNSEDLGPDEMRLIACGTGMPTARPKQAASCWLLELGNGDKFTTTSTKCF